LDWTDSLTLDVVPRPATFLLLVLLVGTNRTFEKLRSAPEVKVARYEVLRGL
jgi:hypothetical protein